ncbi:MAG: hypothetical protein J6L96_09070 [Clostridia bacterium]|nr:hypothetical protein [Clostridia bacterium]
MKKEIIITLLLLAILSSGCSKKDSTEKSTDTASLGKETIVASDDSDNVPEISYETTETADTSLSTTESVINTQSSVVTDDTEITITETSATETTADDIGTLDPDDFLLGEYTTFGYTKLSITDIKVYNSSYPGEENVVVYSAGDKMMINLWCNTEVLMDSILYVVPAGTEHKNSYTKDEAIFSEEMFFLLFESQPGQAEGEITIPKVSKPGVYEFRFVCDSLEEGFISFLIE